MKADPFTILDISRAATFEEARAAYRRLAEIFHPDRFVDARPEIQAEAENQMKRLNEAWGRLRVKLGAEEDDATVRFSRGTDQANPTASPWARQSGDFGDRARHARNRERAQHRREEAENEAENERVRAQASREARERDEFIRQARERMEREQREQPTG